MRILHVSRTMGQGGAEKIVYQLCLDNTCDEQFVASVGGCYVNSLTSIGVKHFIIPDLDGKKLSDIIKTFILLIRIIRKCGIDVVHSHHRMAAFYTNIIIKFLKVKHIYTAHNVFNNKQLLTKWSLSHATIIACGDDVKENLVKFFGISEKQITVIHNSIKPVLKGYVAREIEEKIQQGYTVIGTIGRISEQKGIDVFIKAIAEVNKYNSKIVGVVVGDGELRGEMERLAISLNVSNNILFLGYRENVIDIINQLKFIVLPSRWEGFPLTPIEAFSQGRTVVATNIDGNNEIIQNNYNGILFEKDDYVGLANIIKMLVTNEDKVEELQNNAVLCYEGKYSYNLFINKYKEEYKKI